MVSLPTGLYVLGAVIVALNIGMVVWFGGFLVVPNALSAVILAVVLVWSALGSPGVERLGSYRLD